jgi:Spy/CpxP family protein refolding chaperone
MRISREFRFAAIIITICSPAILGTLTPTQAGTPRVTPFVDRDFEIALSKHLSKRFYARINATEEQRDKLSKIFKETQDGLIVQREELRSRLIELSDMMTDTSTCDDSRACPESS